MTEEISFADLMAFSIHDMKNFVNVHLSELEIIALQAQACGDFDTFKSLMGVIGQTHRMSAHLIQLQAIHKFGQSIYPIDIAEQSVSDIIDDVLSQTRFILEFDGIHVEVECEPDCYWNFDRELVTGVLLNAVNNAFHYTRDKIRVTANIANGLLTLRVEDNGSGFPASMLHDVEIHTEKGVNFISGSTGLGFYFSLQVARMHLSNGIRGTLAIENGGAYGGGCFVAKLP